MEAPSKHRGCQSLAFPPRPLVFTTVTWWRHPSLTSTHALPPPVPSSPSTWACLLFLRDAHLTGALRTTCTLVSPRCEPLLAPHRHLAASFSIFRSVQVPLTQRREVFLITPSGRILSYLNDVLFSSWHTSLSKFVCFLLNY